MEIFTDNARKVIEIWIPKHTDTATVNEACRAHSMPGYLLVIYRSGNEALADLTSELLRINK